MAASTVHVHYARPNGEIFLSGSGATTEEAEKVAFVEARRRLMEAAEVAETAATPSAAVVRVDGQTDAQVRVGDLVYVSPLKSIDVQYLRNVTIVSTDGDSGKPIVSAMIQASKLKLTFDGAYLAHLTDPDGTIRALSTKCYHRAKGDEQFVLAFKHCTFDSPDGMSTAYEAVRRDPLVADKCCLVRVVKSALDVTGSCLLNTSSVVFAKGLCRGELADAFDQFGLHFLFRTFDQFEAAYKASSVDNRCLMAVCERGVPVRAHVFIV